MFLFTIQGYLFQLIATLIGCQLSCSLGTLLGISLTDIANYKSKDTFLNRPINENEASWITLFILIGSLIGSGVFGLMSIKFGRKSSLIWSGLIQVASWFFIAFGYDISHIYASRFLAGLCAGATFTVLPVYICEISEDKSRGNLVSYIILFMNFGIIFGFIIGSQIHYDMVPLIGLIFSVIFSLSFPFVQESPYFYLIEGNITLMEKSMRWFRAIRTLKERTRSDFLNEIDQLKNMGKKFKRQNEWNFRQIKILTIGIILTTGIQICGMFGLLFPNILMKLKLYPNYDYNSFLIIAVFQLIGNVIEIIIADKINRKVLMTISTLGSSLSFIALCTSDLVIENKLLPMEVEEWYTLVCLWSSVLFLNIGLLPLTFVLISEIFPNKNKIDHR